MAKNIAIVSLAILCLIFAGFTGMSVYYYVQIQKKVNAVFQDDKESSVKVLKKGDIIFTGVGIPDKLLSGNEEANINMAQKHLAEKYYNLRKFEKFVKVSNHTVFIFTCPDVEEIDDSRLALSE